MASQGGSVWASKVRGVTTRSESTEESRRRRSARPGKGFFRSGAGFFSVFTASSRSPAFWEEASTAA